MMEKLTQAAMTVGISDEASTAVKAAVILIAGIVSARLAWRASAAVRHLVLAATFGAVLLLPFVSRVTPEFAAFTVSVAPDLEPVVPTTPARALSTGRVGEKPSAAASAPDQRSEWSAQAIVRATWGVGALVGIGLLVRALFRLGRLRRTGLPWLEGRDWMAALAAESGVTRDVDMLRHEEVAAPLAIGLWRPAIFLPADVADWKDEDVRRALLHELEHVRRHDWVVQLAARIACAAHWFNPLVWVAWRLLALEAERACDDAVVVRAESTEYAEQLVVLAERLAHAPAHPALAMARRSDLAVRVTAILDAAQPRGRAGMSAVLAASLVMVALIAVIAPLRAVSDSSAAASGGAAASVADGLAPDGSQSTIAAREEVTQRRQRARAIDRALYEAAEEGDLNQVTDLISAGANVNAAIEGDGSPLIGAARAGRADVVRVLLDSGAEIDRGVEGDGNALIMAAREGHGGVVALLLDRGASIDLIVPGDENALIQASGSGRLDVVQLLIRGGADVNARAWAGEGNGGGEWRTPLVMARRGRHDAVVRALVAAGARD
jgi:beta-lactamase regulating signal transducer with metallopeptidase domain